MGEATKESEVGMEGRSSQNKQEKHPFLFPPLFILIACNWDHLAIAGAWSVFSITPSRLILTLKGRYPHQHLVL